MGKLHLKLEFRSDNKRRIFSDHNDKNEQRKTEQLNQSIKYFQKYCK